MNLLGIDTSAECTHIVLSKGDKIKAIKFKRQFNHYPDSSFLSKMDKLLKSNSIKLKDLDGFIIGRGPGSFTGLRVGFATVFGVNFVFNKPVIGISSLDFIAWNARNMDFDNICVVQDARRALVYGCIYKIESGRVVKKSSYLLIRPDDFVKMIPDNSCVLGTGIDSCKDMFRGFKLLNENYWKIKPEAIIDLGKRIIQRKGLSYFKSKVLPLYLYDKECQIRK
ncbi:MAG: tRNA (adenosine(37)-N6)-threonylcarbamoyltransferase complex dimerization subunit type 1 TsaB [Candidatus Gygaella obscura]|nr:tRNA (adenosine(37)-N6)-threonylcarbamoyltransferase complex dimerization subunit type 1 TsaB [Candidatus Gygaella obscura]